MIKLFGILLLLNILNSQDIRIGSKEFPESYLLAEILAVLIEENTEFTVERKQGLGGTLIVFEAIKNGDIDIYPEYTGTGIQGILKSSYRNNNADSVLGYLNREFGKFGLAWLKPYGFNNSYALAIHRSYPVKMISDLKNYQDIDIAFTHEFLNREDGYPGLKSHYKLNFKNVFGMEHGLSYQAIKDKKIALTDAYSTDGKILKFPVKLLQDDLNFFPSYKAATLISKKIIRDYPLLEDLLEKLEISQNEIIDMNYSVEVEGRDYNHVAKGFLFRKKLISEIKIEKNTDPLLKKILEHLFLTFISVSIAILIAIPLGIIIIHYPKLASFFLGSSSIVQTIPSLAMLGFLIPLFGIGKVPAIIALSIYGILPVLRNTYSGILSVEKDLIEAAEGIGLSPFQSMYHIKLPLALPIIIAGIRTSAVITVGTATLAAFIGAGGLGDFIITGISLNDHKLILKGAIPAAILAIVLELIFSFLENRLGFVYKKKKKTSD